MISVISLPCVLLTVAILRSIYCFAKHYMYITNKCISLESNPGKIQTFG